MWSIGGLAVAGLGVMSYLWFTPGRTPAIHQPHSVASLERVRIGGVDQYILIRGNDASLPVLLFLHGGPGMPAMYLAHSFQRELEKEFVVVQWDRRGAGKSYREDISSTLTTETACRGHRRIDECPPCPVPPGQDLSCGTFLGHLSGNACNVIARL
jgi:pimeloyl-ACP methyl ester carboxylesterase